MKKTIIAVFVLSFVVSSAFAKISVKGTYDFNGDDDGYKTDSGLSLSGEYLWTFGRVVSIGVGAEYLLPRDATDISFLPIYTTAKFKIPAVGLYGKLNLGYSILANNDIPNSSVTGGVYISEAIGYELPLGLFFELGYATYSYSYDYKAIASGSTSYTKMYLGVGYLF